MPKLSQHEGNRIAHKADVLLNLHLVADPKYFKLNAYEVDTLKSIRDKVHKGVALSVAQAIFVGGFTTKVKQYRKQSALRSLEISKAGGVS